MSSQGFKSSEPALSLNIRPVAFAGESWIGYLNRLSHRNRIYGGAHTLAKLLGMTSPQLVVASPEMILPRLNVDLPNARDEMMSQAGATRALRVNLASYGRTMKSRVCAKCLLDDEVPHVRAVWEMPMSMICHRHSAQLVDQCPACGQGIDAMRSNVLQCQCGSDLRFVTQLPASAWVEDLRRTFSEAYELQSTDTFARAHPVSHAAARACRWLISLPEAGSQRRPRRRHSRDGLLSISHALTLRPLLADWPRAILESLAPEGATVRGRNLVADRIGSAHFSSMREVRAALRSRCNLGASPNLRHSRRQASRFANSTSFGIKDLMIATGHSYGMLVRCIDEGQVDGASYSVDPETGTRRFVIPPATFRSIERAFRETSSVKVAAAEAGCSLAAMQGLVRSRSIESNKLALTQLGKMGDRVSPSVLRSFATFLFKRSVPMDALGNDCVPFSKWVPGPYIGPKAARWRLLLEAIREGRVRLFASSRSPVALDDLYLQMDSIVQVLGARRAPR